MIYTHLSVLLRHGSITVTSSLPPKHTPQNNLCKKFVILNFSPLHQTEGDNSPPMRHLISLKLVTCELDVMI